jgi:hypothetical protein
LDLCKQN